MVLINGKEEYSLELYRHRQLPDWLPRKPFLKKGPWGRAATISDAERR